MPLKIPIERAKKRLLDAHGDDVRLIETSYRNYSQSADFIDKDFGLFTNLVHKVCSLTLRQGHPAKKWSRTKNTLIKKYGFDNASKIPSVQEKKKQTTLKHYGVENPFESEEIKCRIKKSNNDRHGVDYPTQNKEIRLKGAVSANKTRPVVYWETGEILDLEGWEDLVAEHWNKQKIKYISQSKTFNLDELGKYTPDFYLPDQNVWIEVKGRWFDEQSKLKWEKFHFLYSNSELWDKKRLRQFSICIPKKR